MMAKDRDALTCDLAETYGIFDITGLPVSLLATLSAGLGDDSRIKRKLAGTDLVLRDQLLAIVADRLGHLIWMISDDGRNGENYPESILDVLIGAEDPDPGQTASFETPEEYESEWERITGVNHGGN